LNINKFFNRYRELLGDIFLQNSRNSDFGMVGIDNKKLTREVENGIEINSDGDEVYVIESESEDENEGIYEIGSQNTQEIENSSSQKIGIEKIVKEKEIKKEKESTNSMKKRQVKVEIRNGKEIYQMSETDSEDEHGHLSDQTLENSPISGRDEVEMDAMNETQPTNNNFYISNEETQQMFPRNFEKNHNEETQLSYSLNEKDDIMEVDKIYKDKISQNEPSQNRNFQKEILFQDNSDDIEYFFFLFFFFPSNKKKIFFLFF